MTPESAKRLELLADFERAIVEAQHKLASPANEHRVNRLREQLAALLREPAAQQWRTVSENNSQRGVAWIDWEATHVGKLSKDYRERYLLKLPTNAAQEQGGRDNGIPEGQGSSSAGALTNGSPSQQQPDANPGSAIPGGAGYVNPNLWQPRHDRCQQGCERHAHGLPPCRGVCYTLTNAAGPAPGAAPGTWRAYDYSGMRYPDESELAGGATDTAPNVAAQEPDSASVGASTGPRAVLGATPAAAASAPLTREEIQESHSYIWRHIWGLSDMSAFHLSRLTDQALRAAPQGMVSIPKEITNRFREAIIAATHEHLLRYESDGMFRAERIYCAIVAAAQQDNSRLAARLAEVERENKDMSERLERATEWAGNQILAMSDDQIQALCRIEGHDPGDEALIGKLSRDKALLLYRAEKAEQALAAASQDVERLDWLATHPRQASIRIGNEFKACNFWGVSAAGDDMRAAIDAVRALPLSEKEG